MQPGLCPFGTCGAHVAAKTRYREEMLHRLAVLIFGFSVLSVVPLFADTATTQPVEVTSTEHVSFAPGGTIRLKDSFGYLSVEGWDQSDVEVTVVRSMGYDPRPARQATQRMEGVHIVTAHGADNELTISTTRPAHPSRFKHPFGTGREAVVEYRIRVPRNSHLVMDHADGYVSVTGVTGNIEASDRRGDIVLMLPDLAKCSIEARTKAGVVTADVPGAIHRKHLMGENFSRGDASLTRRLSLRMGFGGITIKEIPPEAIAPAPGDAR